MHICSWMLIQTIYARSSNTHHKRKYTYMRIYNNIHTQIYIITFHLHSRQIHAHAYTYLQMHTYIDIFSSYMQSKCTAYISIC